MPDQIQELPNCSLARALSVVGERWSLLIIREAVMGSSRFDEFHTRLGIARNILQARLKVLVEAGVFQKAYANGNARIPFYSLTPKGWELLPAIASLLQWGDRWMDDGKGPPVILLDGSNDNSIARVSLRDDGGQIIDPRRIVLRPGPGANARTRKRLAPQL